MHASRIQNLNADTLALGRTGSGTKLAIRARKVPAVLRQSAYEDMYPVRMQLFTADRPHIFTSVHSEGNEAEIYCIRRLGVRNENIAFVNIPDA